jgi:hypothetical protein
MSETEYCPQCGGVIKDAPPQVCWLKNCQRCKTTWLVNAKGTWSPYNSKIKKRYKRSSVAKKQREFEKRHKK